jgi:hypothetical protein
MTAETLRVRADIACVTYTLHMYRYDRAQDAVCTVTTASKTPQVVLILYGSIRFQSYAVESQIQAANKRIGN